MFLGGGLSLGKGESRTGLLKGLNCGGRKQHGLMRLGNLSPAEFP